MAVTLPVPVTLPQGHGGAPLPNFAALLDDPSHQLIETSQQVSQLAGCGTLRDCTARCVPRSWPELPYALAVLADREHHHSLVSPTEYYASRDEAFAAGRSLGHERWIVANTVVRSRKTRAEWTDTLIRQIKEHRERKIQYGYKSYGPDPYTDGR